jgi:23S rRNA (adenine2503-C2)-methyltransferase
MATFFALEPAAAEARVAALGGRAFHARIVRREALVRGVTDYAAMRGLPRELEDALAVELPLLSTVEIRRTQAPDGATKLLLGLAGGGTVETVHIPSHTAGKGATLCVSTQVGCPVACPFCASGKAGLERNLAAHEIVEQYVRGIALGPLSRSVVMGIGEPLLNFASLESALTVVRDEIGIGARRTTVSTVGFPERLARIARANPRFQLAISLHSPDDEERARLVPAMASVPVEAVLAAGDDWFAQTGREVTYEYVLLGGLNDSSGHATRLARRLRGRRATVNLIPYNPIAGDPFRRPGSAAVDAFREELRRHGVVATVRWSRGGAADAACGQLRIEAAGSAS